MPFAFSKLAADIAARRPDPHPDYKPIVEPRSRVSRVKCVYDALVATAISDGLSEHEALVLGSAIICRCSASSQLARDCARLYGEITANIEPLPEIRRPAGTHASARWTEIEQSPVWRPRTI